MVISFGFLLSHLSCGFRWITSFLGLSFLLLLAKQLTPAYEMLSGLEVMNKWRCRHSSTMRWQGSFRSSHEHNFWNLDSLAGVLCPLCPVSPSGKTKLQSTATRIPTSISLVHVTVVLLMCLWVFYSFTPEEIPVSTIKILSNSTKTLQVTLYNCTCLPALHPHLSLVPSCL